MDISFGLNFMPDDFSVVELHGVNILNSHNILESISQDLNPLDDDGN